MEFVKIDAISDPIEDKNGRNYKVFTVSSGSKRTVTGSDGKPYLLDTVGKSAKVLSWESTYLDDKKHWMYDLPVGSLLDGTIYTANVEPYIIKDVDKDGNETQREVSTYTGFVLGFESDAGFETRVRRMILDSGRMPIESESADANFAVAKEHQPSEEKVADEVETPIEEEFGS